jgi:hypothetical protein
MRRLRPLFAAFCVLELGISALAQAPGSRMILLAMARNVKELTSYEWKQKVTVYRKGNPSEPMIEQVRFEGGQMQRTTISAPPEKKMGGIRGKIAENVKDNVKEIMQVAASYNKPQQMIEAVQKAQITPGAGGPTRLDTRDVVKPGDHMTILIDPQTHLTKHIDINSSYQGGPITIAEDYGPIPGGPNAMRTMRVTAPSKELAINVDSYDYVRQSAGAGR